MRQAAGFDGIVAFFPLLRLFVGIVEKIQ